MPEKASTMADIRMNLSSVSPLGKRSANLPAPKGDDGKRIKTMTNNEDPNDKSTRLRAWSNGADHDSSSTIYTLQCFAGNPSNPLPSHVKTCKKAFIQERLRRRGVSTEGTKAVLLDRLRRDLPFVLVDIDGRECLQRAVNAMIQYFGWDNTHLFRCKMPRRGLLDDGATKLVDEFGLDFGIAIRMGNVSADLYDRDVRLRRHIQRKLDGAGLDWSDLDRVIADPELTGPWRRLEGAAFEPFAKSSREYHEINYASGGHLSLEALALRKGDKIRIRYDFGSGNVFTVRVVEVRKASMVLPEVSLGCFNDTRATLLERGNGQIHPQYSD